MNEHDPAGQASGRGVSSPPPWPSFGARAPGDAEETDLPATSVDGEDLLGARTGQRGSADDGPAPAKSAVAEDDTDANYDAGAEYDDDQDDIVIVAASTNSSGAPANGSLTGSVPMPASTAVRPAESARSHTDALFIPASTAVRPAESETGRADAGPVPASTAVGPADSESGRPDTMIIPASAAPGASGGNRADTEADTSPASMGKIPASTATSAGAGDGPDGLPRRRSQAYIGSDPRREQWRSIQSAFVDDPRSSVAAAADLATKEIGLLVARVQKRERELRGEWDRDDTDTERLRNALRHYRDFLERLPTL